MSANIKLAGAPITWGVCEVPGWGVQMAGHSVLAEIAAAGLKATELGPRGFLPDNGADTQVLLARYGLSLVAGFVPAVLHTMPSLNEALAGVDAAARTLSGAGAEVLVLAAETGNSGYESTEALTEAEWQTLFGAFDQVENIARAHGLRVALHPHYGTVVENARQISRVLDHSRIPICLDTGHLMVAGADPLVIARQAGSRITHVHLKDVNATLARRVQQGEIGYRDAVAAGLYCPLGDGDVNLAAIFQQLQNIGYEGWFVMEQDLVLDANSPIDLPFVNAVRSAAFIRQLAA